MIIDIQPSKKKNKRFMITMDNGNTYDFGLKFGSTYIDHHNKKLRTNYIKRHLGNKTERVLCENLIPSASLFSMYLLWGRYTDLYKNIDILNNLWKKRYH